MEYKFYMRQYPDGVEKDLEVEFEGLHYAKCEGLESKGKAKNIYTESFADSSETSVYVPEEICEDAVEITFTFAFDGANRRATFNSFCTFIKSGVIEYRDTARNKKAWLLLDGNTEPSEDEIIGSHPYILAEFKFKTIKPTINL